ncbi:MAG: ion transporter [Bradymonadia bacterium]
MAPSHPFKRWTAGFAASVAMVVATFVPWAPGDGSFGMHEGIAGAPGVRFLAGQIALGTGVLSLALWLLSRARLGGLMALAGGATAMCGLGFVPTLSLGGEPLWGFWLYVVTAGLATVLSVSQPLRSKADVRALKDTIDHRLNPQTGDSRFVDTLIITLIAINIVLVMLETEPEIAHQYGPSFLVAETISTWVFAVEYLLRVWVVDVTDDRRMPRLRYMFSVMAIIDLVAIAPFFLQFMQMDLRIARAIRLMRLLRILKMGRYARAVRTLANVVVSKREELAISTFVSSMVLILSASAMYFAEHEAQPEAFRSIPSTMWWAVVTLTSVGYGDVSPVTGVGQLIGAVVCLSGVLLVALPTGILASGFLEEMRRQRMGNESEVFGFCPHCGKRLLPHEED